MTASNYVHLDNCEILKETELAFLIRVDEGDDLWFPKSQIADASDYKEGDKGTISVTEWIANEKGVG